MDLKFLLPLCHFSPHMCNVIAKVGKGTGFMLRVRTYITHILLLNLKLRGKGCPFNAVGFTSSPCLDIRVTYTCTFGTYGPATVSNLSLTRFMKVFKKIKFSFNNKGSILSVSTQEGTQTS